MVLALDRTAWREARPHANEGRLNGCGILGTQGHVSEDATRAPTGGLIA